MFNFLKSLISSFEFILTLNGFNLLYSSRFLMLCYKCIDQSIRHLCPFLPSSCIFFCDKYSKISNFIACDSYLFILFHFCKFKFNFIFMYVFLTIGSNFFEVLSNQLRRYFLFRLNMLANQILKFFYLI